MLREAPVCCLLAVGQVDEEKNLILRNLLQVMGYGGGSQSAIKGVIVQFSSAVKSMFFNLVYFYWVGVSDI